MATADTRHVRERIVRINIKMPPALHGSDRDAVGTDAAQVVDRLALQRELSAVVSGEVRFGLEMEPPDSGCCGMAGAFGFESQHYDTAMKIGERVLLPAVRRASKDTLIVSDGFSCHEQIAQSTDREPLHLAEVLDMAMAQSQRAPLDEYPERAYVPRHVRYEPLPWRSAAAIALIAAGLIGTAAAAVRATRA